MGIHEHEIRTKSDRLIAAIEALTNTIEIGHYDYGRSLDMSEDMSDAFTTGDVVELIIGGPEMVVISTCPKDCVEVAWANSDGDVQIDVFPAEALIDV